VEEASFKSESSRLSDQEKVSSQAELFGPEKLVGRFTQKESLGDLLDDIGKHFKRVL
jgi:hypothetical protein